MVIYTIRARLNLSADRCVSSTLGWHQIKIAPSPSVVRKCISHIFIKKNWLLLILSLIGARGRITVEVSLELRSPIKVSATHSFISDR